jgi:hypothetical protein
VRTAATTAGMTVETIVLVPAAAEEEILVEDETWLVVEEVAPVEGGTVFLETDGAEMNTKTIKNSCP